MVSRPEGYDVEPFEEPELYRVRTGDGRVFLVACLLDPARGGPRTIVFEGQGVFWISRRDVPARLAPAQAVGGWLLGGTGAEEDPLTRLRKDAETTRRGYWQLLRADQENREERLRLLREIEGLRRERDSLKARLGGTRRRRNG